MSDRRALGEMTTKIGSGATPRGGKAVYQQEGVAFIRSMNVLDNGMKLEPIARLSPDAADQLRGVTVEPGDVLINITGDSIARCCVVETDALPARVSQHVAIVRPTADLDSRFLQRYLVHPTTKDYLLSISDGGTRKALTKRSLSELSVPCPPLRVQQAIAEVLGALDDKIAANTRTVDAARHLIRARVSVAGTSCALRDVAILNKSSVNPQSMSAPTVAHFSLPAFDEGAWPEIVVPSQIKSNKFMVPGPAVLLSKLNPRIPRVWDVVGPPENSLASTEFLVLTTEVPSTALWGAISQPATQVELASKVAGTSGSHQRVRPEEVMDLRIPDPRSLSQNVLAAIDGLGRCVWSLQAESQSLVRTRDELLPLLMSGKVRVKDAERVVEEVV